MANIKSLVLGFGKDKQSSILTADTSPLICFTPTSREVPGPPTLNRQNNRDEIGGGMWPDKIYNTNAIFEAPLTFRSASQNLAYFMAWAFGTVTKSAAGDGFKYTCLPKANREMESFTMASQLLAGTGDEVFDLAHIGVMVDSISFNLKQGTDADTCTFNVGLVGSGKFTNDAGLTVPAPLTVNPLTIANIYNLAFVGQDYDSSCRLLGLTFNYQNNIKREQNYRPCGGNSQNGFFVMSRGLAGSPTCTITARIEAPAGAAEITDFLAQTNGTLDIELQGDAISGSGGHKHGIRIQVGKTPITSLKIGEDDETVIYDLTYEVLTPASGEALQVDVKTTLDAIMGL